MPTNQSGAGKLGCSCRTGSAAPLGEGASPGAASSGWSRRAPWGPHSSAKGSAGFQPNAPPSQCIRLSKDLSGLQKVSQLNFAFCSSFRCPAQQCYLQSRTLWELFGSGRQRSKKDFTIKELLGCAPPPNSGPVSDSSVKGEPNTEHYTPPKPL